MAISAKPSAYKFIYKHNYHDGTGICVKPWTICNHGAEMVTKFDIHFSPTVWRETLEGENIGGFGE